MGLRIVYGKSGTGKSQYVFDEVAEKLEDNKIYIITPEQFSFTAEKKLMETIKQNAVINAEVLTFERMAYRVINETGGAIQINLSKCGKAMLLYDVLNKYKKELTFLGKSNENVALIARSLTELKKHNVTVDNLKQEMEKTQDTYLKLKLQDIVTVYEKFQEIIEGQYIDENDILTILKEKLDQTKQFKNALIYIDEFSGFTSQEYAILLKLLQMAKQVTITLATDSLQETLNPDTDIFYANKQTASRVLQLAKDNTIPIEDTICLEKQKRFQNRELIHIEENLYALPYTQYKEEVRNIQLLLANNQYTEIENVAKQIVYLVRDKHYHYRDISVITKNIATYSSLVKAIFHSYAIPVFIDEKKDLSQNLIVKYVIAILDIFSKNWSYESVFHYLKTGLVEIEQEDMYQIENYCIRWGIKGNKWYKQDWNYGVVNEEDKKQVQWFNTIRKEIVTPLLELKQKIQQNRTVEEITKVLYEFLIEQQIDSKLEEKIQDLEELGYIEIANEYRSSFQVVMEILDEMVLIFPKKEITFEKYIELLKIGLKNSGLGKIPATQDQVIVGDVDRSRSHKVKAIFIIGLNDGSFPSVNKEEGFLNDKDRSSLKEQGIELAKGTVERLYEDNYNIYKAFTTAEEKLFLSYASSDIEGKALRPSILIARLKKMFPKLQEQTDRQQEENLILTKETTFEKLIEQLRCLEEGKKIDDIWFTIYQYYKKEPIWKYRLEKSLLGVSYTNIPEKIEKDAIEKLYGTVLHTTISRLEQYRSCPFSFYLKYGLKLKEKPTFQLQSLDTGSFMHDVIDEFFTKMRIHQRKPKEMNKEEIKEIVEEIIQEKLNLPRNYIFISSPKFKVLTNRLKKVLVQAIYYIIQGLKNTDFEVTGNEIEFKAGSEYKPIRIELEDGKAVEITGKIDRIDIAQNAEGKFVRIIDYKSSIKNIDLNEVMAGLQIQLLTYLDAVCQVQEVMPAGVLYFSLIDPIIKSNKSMTEEEIEEEIKKRFKMNGMILADVTVVKMMDKSLEKGSSSVIPAYIDKEGNLSKSKSNVATKEQFVLLQNYVKKTMQEIAKEILNGQIDLKPYYNIKSKKTPCEYCAYKAICQFNPGFCGNNYQYIGNLDKNEVLEKMKTSES